MRLISTSFFRILILIVHIMPGCKQNSSSYSDKLTRPEIKISVSENEIYSFMQNVITEQKLRKDNGLSISPGRHIDEEFLKKCLIDSVKEEVNYDTTGWPNMTIMSFDQFTKCLTEADINFILQQKADLSNFKWNNDKLGFNISNKEDWYEFSVPLFSKDRTKAIIQISNLCKGLCGAGSIILFKKENEQWTAETLTSWFH